MTQDHWPKPKGYIRLGRGNYAMPDSSTRFPALDRDAAKAERPKVRPVQKRVIIDNRRTYTAYDAHSLLESEDYSHRARPGHPLG